jgi:hypothetical protein
VPILEDIREALANSAYRIAGHAADRMLAENLDEIWVLEATIAGTAVDEFPATYPHPSCIVAGQPAVGAGIHALWAYDGASGYAVLLTVYRAERG